MLMAAGRRGAARRVRARLAARRRREDVEVEAHRHRARREITDVFGSDAYRFYFLSAIAFGQDGSFSWEDLSARYQAELANGFGNLASRTIAMIERYFEGIVPPAGEYTEARSRDPADGGGCRGRAPTRRSSASRIDEAITAIWTIVDALNRYITENEPWALAKDDAQRDRLGTVLYTAAEGLRALAVLLSPVHADRDREALDRARRGRDARAALPTSRSARRGAGASCPRARR